MSVENIQNKISYCNDPVIIIIIIMYLKKYLIKRPVKCNRKVTSEWDITKRFLHYSKHSVNSRCYVRK